MDFERVRAAEAMHHVFLFGIVLFPRDAAWSKDLPDTAHTTLNTENNNT